MLEQFKEFQVLFMLSGVLALITILLRKNEKAMNAGYLTYSTISWVMSLLGTMAGGADPLGRWLFMAILTLSMTAAFLLKRYRQTFMAIMTFCLVVIPVSWPQNGFMILSGKLLERKTEELQKIAAAQIMPLRESFGRSLAHYDSLQIMALEEELEIAVQDRDDEQNSGKYSGSRGGAGVSNARTYQALDLEVERISDKVAEHASHMGYLYALLDRKTLAPVDSLPPMQTNTMTELHFTGTDLRKIIPPYDWTPEGFDSTKVHTLRFEDLSIPQIMTEYERVLSWCRSMPFPVETVSITVNQINVMSIFAELIKKFWIVILLAFLPDLASFYCLTRVKPQRTTMLAAVFTLEWLAYLLFIVSFIASGAGLWIINAPLQMWLMTMVPIAVGLVAAVYFSRLNYFKYWTIVVALICQQIVAWPLSIPTNATGLSKPVYEAENLRYVQDRWGDLSSSKSNLYTAKLKPYREDMRRKKEKMWQDLGAFNSATNFSLSAFTTPNIDKERAMEMFGKDSVKISSWEKYDRSHKTVLKLEESQHDTLTNLLKLPPIGRVTVHNVRSQYRMLFQEEASRWNLKYTSEDEASYVKDQDGPKKIEGKLLDWGPGVTRGFTLGVVFKQGIMQFFASTNVEIYAALFLILGWFYRRRVVVANSPL